MPQVHTFTPTPLELAILTVLRVAIDDAIEIDWKHEHAPTRTGLVAMLLVDPPDALHVGASRTLCEDEGTGDFEETIAQWVGVTGEVEFRGPGAMQAATGMRLMSQSSEFISACLANNLGLRESVPPSRVPIQLGRGVLDRVTVEFFFDATESLARTTTEVVAESTLLLSDDEAGEDLALITQDFT